MITTLTGPNSFEVQLRLNKIVNNFVKEFGDFGLEKLDGEEASVEQLQGSLESLPFLAPKKLVVLRSPSANKQFAEQFEAIIDRVAESTDVVIVEPKLDKRLSYYKQLKKQTDFIECNELDGRQLASWLIGQAKDQSGDLSSSDAYYLVERVGVNQQLIHNELQKLLSYDLDISRQNIDLLTEQTPQSTIFQLLDAAFNGDAKKALKLYDEQRRQKVEPLAMMGMLAWQLHILAVIKTAGKRSSGEIASQARINPYVVQKSQAIADKLSLAELKTLIHQATDLDEKLKTSAIDSDGAIQQLLIDIADLS